MTEDDIQAMVEVNKQEEVGGVKTTRERINELAKAPEPFTNPDGDSAGRLIDTAGGKGLRVGTAEVSDKHANFIQADEGGTAADVLQVMNEVRTLVEFAHGVVLQPETHLVGFTDDEVPWSS